MLSKPVGIVEWSINYLRSEGLGIDEGTREVIRTAHELGFQAVILGGQANLRPGDDRRNAEFLSYAEKLGLCIGLSFWFESLYQSALKKGPNPFFELAKQCNLKVIGTVLNHFSIRFDKKWNRNDAVASIQTAVKKLKAVSSVAEEYGIGLAFENHIDYTCDELDEILSAVPSPFIGLRFDTANQVLLGEDPVMMCRRFRTRVLDTHLKDCYLVPDSQGAQLVWCAPGDGIVDVKGMMEMLEEEKRAIPTTLETFAESAFTIPFKTEAFWQYLGFGQPARRQAEEYLHGLTDAKNRKPDFPDRKAWRQYERELLSKGGKYLMNWFG